VRPVKGKVNTKQPGAKGYGQPGCRPYANETGLQLGIVGGTRESEGGVLRVRRESREGRKMTREIERKTPAQPRRNTQKKTLCER